MKPRNSTPRHIWDVLLRLRNANKTQLAASLGVSRQTLSRWIALTEAGEQPGATASRHAADLLQATLRAANDADVYAIPQINWNAVHKIGGRR